MTEIDKCLVLSTAHVPKPQGPDGPQEGWGGYRTVRHEYGWIVWLGVMPCLECPEWLVPIVRLARQEGATMIDFDGDAAVADGLEEYEW